MNSFSYCRGVIFVTFPQDEDDEGSLKDNNIYIQKLRRAHEEYMEKSDNYEKIHNECVELEQVRNYSFLWGRMHPNSTVFFSREFSLANRCSTRIHLDAIRFSSRSVSHLLPQSPEESKGEGVGWQLNLRKNTGPSRSFFSFFFFMVVNIFAYRSRRRFELCEW